VDFKFLLAALLLGAPAGAEDWLLGAQKAAAAAPVPGEAPPEAAKGASVSYEPASRLFRADLPSSGWRPFEEEDALGLVVRVLGPDDPSGTLRAALTVRLIDRDAPNFAPAKTAVEALRREAPGREATAVRPLRISAGLARVFEIVDTRRLPLDEGPSLPVEIHEYVAVVARGEAYYLIRLVSTRAAYLDYREDFTRFLKTFRPLGAR
jgi:hypothetical protein